MAATLVQSSGAKSGGGTTEGHTWASPPTAGNTIVVVAVGWGNPTAPTMSVADGGNTYTQHATQASTGTTTTRVSIFSAPVGSVPTTTTLTFNISADHSVVFTEWSGLTASPYDTNALADGGTVSGSGSIPRSVGPTATLAQADELIITGFGAGTGLPNSLISAPSGYTGIAFEQNSPSFIGMGSAYQVVSSTAAVSATWPVSYAGGGGQTAVAAIATFKIAGGGSPYSLPYDATSYALTGSTETLAAGRALPVSAASYGVTASAVTLGVGRKLDVAATSYAVTASAETLTATRALSIDPASYALNAAPVTLTYESLNKSLNVDPVSYALSAADVGFTAPRRGAEAEQQSYPGAEKKARKYSYDYSSPKQEPVAQKGEKPAKAPAKVKPKKAIPDDMAEMLRLLESSQVVTAEVLAEQRSIFAIEAQRQAEEEDELIAIIALAL